MSPRASSNISCSHYMHKATLFYINKSLISYMISITSYCELIIFYLLRMSVVISFDSIRKLQQKEIQQAQAQFKKTQQLIPQNAIDLFHSGKDPVVNGKGTVTLVEFFDYQCPHCINMTAVIDAIAEKNKDLRIVYKELPIFGGNSQYAAKAALAAAKQGKYDEFHHALMKAKPPLTNDTVLAIAKDTGLDVDQLKKDMDSKAVADILANNTKIAGKLGILGTPAFFIAATNINKETPAAETSFIPGQIDQEQLQKIIDKTKQG